MYSSGFTAHCRRQNASRAGVCPNRVPCLAAGRGPVRADGEILIVLIAELHVEGDGDRSVFEHPQSFVRNLAAVLRSLLEVRHLACATGVPPALERCHIRRMMETWRDRRIVDPPVATADWRKYLIVLTEVRLQAAVWCDRHGGRPANRRSNADGEGTSTHQVSPRNGISSVCSVFFGQRASPLGTSSCTQRSPCVRNWMYAPRQRLSVRRTPPPCTRISYRATVRILEAPFLGCAVHGMGVFCSPDVLRMPFAANAGVLDKTVGKSASLV